MSKAKDRARAESGKIWRNGKLWDKEEWYALHPNKQSLARQRAEVRAAVNAELDKKFKQEDKPYFCTKCGRKHRPGTKVWHEHKEVSNSG